MTTVQEYLDKSRLAQHIEESVNVAVRSRAEDPVIYVANYLRRVSTPTIKSLSSRKIIDSFGSGAIEVDLVTNRGTFRATVSSFDPSASPREPDDDEAVDLSYAGTVISAAVEAIKSKLAPALTGRDPRNQEDLDRLLKNNLNGIEIEEDAGRIASLAISIAICKAGAAESELPVYQYIAELAGSERSVLPVPDFSAIIGGPTAKNKFPFQDVSVVPTGAENFHEALHMGLKLYSSLKAIITEKYGEDNSREGQPGAFAPPVNSPREVLEILQLAVERTGLSGKISFGADVAATNFATESDNYDLDWKDSQKKGSRERTGGQLIEMYQELCTDFPLISLTDPFETNDFESSTALTQLGRCQVVGAKILAAKFPRVSVAVENKACNAICLKVSDLSSVSDIVELVKMARLASWAIIVDSTGSCGDHFLADLAVGLGAWQIRLPLPGGGGNVENTNELLRIEEELGERGGFAGKDWGEKKKKGGDE